MSKITFDPLYKRASSGAIQKWQIAVDGCVIITRWGKIDGAIQETRDTIKEGKNLGRANATTPEQQAEAEAKAMWEKKLKKDYVRTIEDAEAGKSSELIEGGILPMLAHKFSEYGDKIVYPAFCQPKLDGNRCTAILDSRGKCTLWSRTRKPINSMPHIVSAVEVLGYKGMTFDGELYNHEYHDKFEELEHLIRSSKPAEGHEIVQYHVYDLAMPGIYLERLRVLEVAFNSFRSDSLKFVETIRVENEDDLMAAFNKFLDEKYEGAIVRNAAGLYVNKRSYDLQKIKTMQDDEFKVLDVKEGRGRLAGHAVFVCEVKPGITVDAKMKGKLEKLKQYWDNPALAIGRRLTIQYQGFTNTGSLRFPVALRFREDL